MPGRQESFPSAAAWCLLNKINTGYRGRYVYGEQVTEKVLYHGSEIGNGEPD